MMTKPLQPLSCAALLALRHLYELLEHPSYGGSFGKALDEAMADGLAMNWPLMAMMAAKKGTHLATLLEKADATTLDWQGMAEQAKEYEHFLLILKIAPSGALDWSSLAMTCTHDHRVPERGEVGRLELLFRLAPEGTFTD